MCVKLLLDLLYVVGNGGLALESIFCRQQPRQHLCTDHMNIN